MNAMYIKMKSDYVSDLHFDYFSLTDSDFSVTDSEVLTVTN